MEHHAPLPSSRINDDLLGFVLARRAPRWFWIAILICGAILLAWAVVVGGLIVDGLQLLGLSDNVYWAIFIPEGAFGKRPVRHHLYAFTLAGGVCDFIVGLLLTIAVQLPYRRSRAASRSCRFHR